MNIDKVSGLNNIGNTCFMNSALQLLINCRILTKFIISTDFDNPKLRTYKRFLEEYHSYHVITPHELKNIVSMDNPIFRGSRQHDAHEFLVKLLDLIDTEIKKEFKNSSQSIATTKNNNIENKRLLDVIFNNNISSTVFSNEVNDESTIDVPEKTLSLPIKGNTLNKCLQSFQQIEILEDKWFSEKFNKKVNASKQLSINKFAKYLIIHLKRFNYDRRSSKNGSSVEFDEYMTLNDNNYELRSIVLHSGGTDGGHYVAVVKKNDTWYMCNDASINKTDVQQFLNVGYIYLYSKRKH